MKVYQITDRGHRWLTNPRLARTNEYAVLKELDSRTGADRQQLESVTGLSSGEVASALVRLQSAKFVLGV